MNNKQLSDEDFLALLKKKLAALRKAMNGERLTFEETAFAIWDIDKEARPMSPMGICKLQKRILEKCNDKLSKVGIKSSDDVFEPKDREVAKKVTSSAVDI